MTREEFIKYEPIACKLFTQSIKKNRLSSAYLLYGTDNAPLKDVALFLSKSINCDSPVDYLACENCRSCEKFNANIRPDLMILDGKNQSIKREDIDALQDKFSKSGLEKNHRPIYIINNVENVTWQSIDLLLKFIEEPKDDRIGFLTCNNLDNVKPTILSRCIKVRIDPIDKNILINDLLNNPPLLERKKKESTALTYGQAYFLSSFFSTRSEIENTLNLDDSFFSGYEMAEEILNTFSISFTRAGYLILKKSNEKYDSKCYNWLYLILHNVFLASILDDVDDNHPFKQVILDLQKRKETISKADEIIRDILYKNSIPLNLNKSLSAARIALALNEV